MITDRHNGLVKDLLRVWDASVRATHDFLTEEDIACLYPQVRQALAEVKSVALWELPGTR